MTGRTPRILSAISLRPVGHLSGLRPLMLRGDIDVAALIDNNARIKVVVKDATGAPIAGINVTRIVIELNGGTPAQGFGGNGADSVIANHDFNQNPPCPDLRPIYADAPTDAAGVTSATTTSSTSA